MLRWAPHEHYWVGTHMSVSRYSPSTKLNTLRRVLKIDRKKGEALDWGRLGFQFGDCIQPSSEA